MQLLRSHIVFLLVMACLGCSKIPPSESTNAESAEFQKQKIWAEKGAPEDEAILAYCYLRGKGVGQSYDSAIQWFKKAAEQGEPKSQLMLGRILVSDQIGIKQYSEGAQWLQKAAKHWPFAGMDLGQLYANGRGVERDPYLAYYWFCAARNAGMKDRPSYVADLERQLTPSEIARAEKAAQTYQRKR